ncbi:MAG: chorismate synthase [Ruminococcus sp.]|nr:chorismate synthase [Ruminococcus sp.]
MKHTFGQSVALTIFGESHGTAIGAVLDGLAPGIPVDEDFIARQMSLRKAVGDISTPRREADAVRILSGVFNGRSTGTPITFMIENQDTYSRDYGELAYKARPGHADLTAQMKYHGYQDFRGGGHFSGRITAGIVAAGAVAITALRGKGIKIGTHILACGGVKDRTFGDVSADIDKLDGLPFAVLNDECKDKMTEAILAAKQEGDSVGGVLETAVYGFPAGVGEPWFDTLEGVLSHALFSIPAVKGVEFGAGFGVSELRGSQSNDPFRSEDGKVVTDGNNCGGILGGISDGMPIVFRCGVKPTPSIYKEQQTVNMNTSENTTLQIQGRHDPAIVHRARVVADSITALVLCDQLALRFGTDWLAGNDNNTDKTQGEI